MTTLPIQSAPRSYIQYDANGRITTFVGPDATLLLSVMTLRSALGLWHVAGIVQTRGVTITEMLAKVSSVTGKTYRRNSALRAIADLKVWINVMRCALPIHPQPNPTV
jgi:hypothetical protein